MTNSYFSEGWPNHQPVIWWFVYVFIYIVFKCAVMSIIIFIIICQGVYNIYIPLKIYNYIVSMHIIYLYMFSMCMALPACHKQPRNHRRSQSSEPVKLGPWPRQSRKVFLLKSCSNGLVAGSGRFRFQRQKIVINSIIYIYTYT